MTAILQRLSESPLGTLGQIDLDGRVLKTIERPGTGPNPRIPAGLYTCRRDFFHAGGYEAFEVTGVPGRSRILIHIANRASELRGCIAPGMAYGSFPVRPEDGDDGLPVEGVSHLPGVTQSGLAFQKLMAHFANVHDWPLEIRDIADLPDPDVGPGTPSPRVERSHMPERVE